MFQESVCMSKQIVVNGKRFLRWGHQHCRHERTKEKEQLQLARNAHLFEPEKEAREKKKKNENKGKNPKECTRQNLLSKP